MPAYISDLSNSLFFPRFFSVFLKYSFFLFFYGPEMDVKMPARGGHFFKAFYYQYFPNQILRDLRISANSSKTTSFKTLI